MSHHTKLDEKLEGVDNFWAWKYRISLVLEENELDSYIHEEVPVPEEDEAKSLHKKKLVMEKRIISDSIKDHLIPQVSSLKTPKADVWCPNQTVWREEHQSEDDSKETVEECKHPEWGDHIVTLHKGLPD